VSDATEMVRSHGKEAAIETVLKDASHGFSGWLSGQRRLSRKFSKAVSGRQPLPCIRRGGLLPGLSRFYGLFGKKAAS